MITDINSEDRLVQATFAEHLEKVLGWESVYAWNDETFWPNGTLGRADTREVVLTRDLRTALARLNPQLPPVAIAEAMGKLTRHDFSRSLLQHNQEFYQFIRGGVPVSHRDAQGQLRHAHARVIDFQNGKDTDGKPNNRFIAVRELKITGLRAPGYNRRADLVCFVNGLPLVFVELKAVYKNIRAGFDGNLTDYKDTIPHALHHNAFLIVSNGHHARYGSITSQWEHFGEWKRLDERDKGSVEAEVLPDGMSAWEKYIHAEAPDRLVQLGILHVEFEALHPFMDGNGRIGRMFVPLFLFKAGLLSRPTLYISAFFERNRDEYYERLRAVSRDGAWTEWAGFFLKAIQTQAEGNQDKAQAILKLYETKKAWMTESTRSLYAIHALDFLFRRPVFETSEFTSQKSIPTPTAHRILGLLRKHGVFKVLRESRGRRPGVLAFRELLNIVEGRDAF